MSERAILGSAPTIECANLIGRQTASSQSIQQFALAHSNAGMMAQLEVGTNSHISGCHFSVGTGRLWALKRYGPCSFCCQVSRSLGRHRTRNSATSAVVLSSRAAETAPLITAAVNAPEAR